MFLHKLAQVVVLSLAEFALFGAFLIAALVHYSRQAMILPGRLLKKWSKH